MLSSKKIEKFLKLNPKGYVEIIQYDGVNFRITPNVSYYIDDFSITFFNITYIIKKYGNTYKKKGNFMLPFKSILRVEYIKEDELQ